MFGFALMHSPSPSCWDGVCGLSFCLDTGPSLCLHADLREKDFIVYWLVCAEDTLSFYLCHSKMTRIFIFVPRDYKSCCCGEPISCAQPNGGSGGTAEFLPLTAARWAADPRLSDGVVCRRPSTFHGPSSAVSFLFTRGFQTPNQRLETLKASIKVSKLERL